MSILSDLGTTLEGIAPTLAGVVGGPFAKMGVTELEKLFGLNPDPSAAMTDRAAAVKAALEGMTPQQTIALKKLDDEFRQQMVDAGVNLAGLGVKDRQSAREMEQTSKSVVPAFLTSLTIFSVAGVAYLLFTGKVATKDPAIFAMIGAVITELLHTLRSVIGFWFGGFPNTNQLSSRIKGALKIGTTLSKPPTQ